MSTRSEEYNNPGKTKYSDIRIPELLAPAGSFEKMAAAIHYGADAVYGGGKKFSLRAHAGNFTEKDLKRAVLYAHNKKTKFYVTVNILAHQKDLQGLEDYLRYLGEIEVDGIIISDPGILVMAQKIIPGVPIHLSTQANVTNPGNAEFWQSQGVARLNLARELSLAEVAEIRNRLAASTRIEIFVHGSLCISYSGRCLLSYYFTGRDANRGDCAHPCRYRYVLEEEKRPGQFFPVEEDEHGTYIFNSKDLCLLNRLPQLLDIGVDSLKIEGRMKSVYYVGSVVRIYRAALDYLAHKLTDNLSSIRSLKLPQQYMEELMKVGTRGYTENFIFGPPDADDMLYDRPRSDQDYVPVGIVKDSGELLQTGGRLTVEVRNPLIKGDTVEYLGRGIKTIPFVVQELLDEGGIPLTQANPGNIVKIQYESLADIALEAGSLLRKKK
jgi:U32 family peptidase